MPLRTRLASEAWLTRAVVLLATAPVVVVLIEALAHGYAPSGDRAVVATRAYDVLSAHPPLVGAYSTASALTGVDTYSPGPLLYWLLAIPARLPGFWALPTTIAFLNGACVAATVLLARRRGGPTLMVVTAASMMVLYSSLPTDLANDIWAPSAPVLPFALLVIVGWSIACGDVFLLPLAVVLVSFTSQGHLAYLLPGLSILAVAGAGLILCMRMTDTTPPAVASRYPVSRSVLLAGLAAVVCWSFPVLDQILGWAGKPRAREPGSHRQHRGGRGTYGGDRRRDAGACPRDRHTTVVAAPPLATGGQDVRALQPGFPPGPGHDDRGARGTGRCCRNRLASQEDRRSRGLRTRRRPLPGVGRLHRAVSE